MTTKIKDVIAHIESFAPPALQESYDNAGLIVGDKNQDLKGILICLDSIEAVVDEAIEMGANLIVAHHPILFSGLKKITGNSYMERVIIKAIKNDIAIYAAHTNLDNVQNGVNAIFAEKLGLTNTKILSPKKGLLNKLITFIPESHLNAVQNALYEAGAGKIGKYSECGFSAKGRGTFKAEEGTTPFVGERGKRHTESEYRLETIFPSHLKGKIIQALNTHHPYEEVAYDIYSVENIWTEVGSGMIGTLNESMEIIDFLTFLKDKMKCGSIKYTKPHKKKISKVAICGGSGSFLLGSAKAKNADIFITGDFKYHQFFDAEDKIIIADIGHYESEQYTNELFYNLLKEKFSTFAIRVTNLNTNPINYF